jgi:acyl carrier protein
MLAHLAEIARERGLGRLRINFISSAKNKPAREFLESIGMKFVASNGDSHQFELTPSLIVALCESPKASSAPSSCEEKIPATVESPAETESQNKYGAGNRKSRILKRIAIELCDSGKVAEAIRKTSVIQRRAVGGFAPPETDFQELLASLWAEILNVEAVGIRDNFFDLGGHSLMAMQLAFKIEETFNVSFPLESFLRAPVLAEQAERIQDLLLEEAGDAECLEGLIDELEQTPEDTTPSSAGNHTIASGAREVM